MVRREGRALAGAHLAALALGIRLLLLGRGLRRVGLGLVLLLDLLLLRIGQLVRDLLDLFRRHGG